MTIKRTFLLTFLVIISIVLVVPAAAADTSTSIVIPSLGVDAPIVSIGLKTYPDGNVTWDTSKLGTKVGHLDGTPWFGQGGNIVLGGHSELARGQASVFINLHNTQVGDVITVNADGAQLLYTVTEVKVVEENDLSILYPTSGERLTIMTCDTTSYANGNYGRRVVVIAERTG